MKLLADRQTATGSVQAAIRQTFGAEPRSAKPTFCRSTFRRSSGYRRPAASNIEVDALEGQDPAALGSVMSGLINAANRDPRLTRVFSTFTATNPSIYLDIDRAGRHRPLGLNMSDVFTALQATLGGVYVNNFNLSAAPGRSTCRARLPTGLTFPISGRSTCETAPATWCRSARSRV